MYHAKTKGRGIEKLSFYGYEGFEQTNYDHELHREINAFKKLIEERNRVVHVKKWMEA